MVCAPVFPRMWPTKLKALERENRELRQANEILRKASAYFCPGGARPPVQAIDCLHRRSSPGAWGRADLQDVADRPVEKAYHAHVAKRVDPSRLSARDRRDAALKGGGPARV